MRTLNLFEQTLVIFEEHHQDILNEIAHPGGTQHWRPLRQRSFDAFICIDATRSLQMAHSGHGRGSAGQTTTPQPPPPARFMWRSVPISLWLAKRHRGDRLPFIGPSPGPGIVRRTGHSSFAHSLASMPYRSISWSSRYRPRRPDLPHSILSTSSLARRLRKMMAPSRWHVRGNMETRLAGHGSTRAGKNRSVHPPMILKQELVYRYKQQDRFAKRTTEVPPTGRSPVQPGVFQVTSTDGNIA
jgi:hypothetical protein